MSKPETRVDRLFVAFTTIKDWSTGGTKPRDVWEFDSASKDIASLTRRTKTVTTEIDKLLSELGADRFNVLSEEEKQAMAAARTAIRRLGADVEHAKERVKRHFSIKKEEDKKQEEDARKAIKQTFPLVDIEETLLLLIAIGDSYVLQDIRMSVLKNNTQDVHDHVTQVAKEVTQGLVRKLREAMKQGVTMPVAALDMRRKYNESRPALLEKHGDFIRQVKAALVQWEFENRNRPNV